MTPLSFPFFFHIPPPFLMAVIFADDPAPSENLPSQDLNFFFSIFYYSPTSCYCAHYEDDIYNPYTTESCLFKNTNQKKEKSISDLLVMAIPKSS